MDNIEKEVRQALEAGATPPVLLWQTVLERAAEQTVSPNDSSVIQLAPRRSSSQIFGFLQVAAAAVFIVALLVSTWNPSSNPFHTDVSHALEQILISDSPGEFEYVDQTIVFTAVNGKYADRMSEYEMFVDSGLTFLTLPAFLESTGLTLRDTTVTPLRVACQLSPRNALRIVESRVPADSLVTFNGQVKWKLARDLNPQVLEKHCEEILTESVSYLRKIESDPAVTSDFTLQFVSCVSPARPLEISVYPSIKGLTDKNLLCAANDSFPLRATHQFTAFQFQSQLLRALKSELLEPQNVERVEYPGFSRFP